MYIKFCRIYNEDKQEKRSTDSSSESLSTEAEDKGPSRLQDVRLWKGVSACLAGICLLLLLVVIVLLVKPKTDTTLTNSDLTTVEKALCSRGGPTTPAPAAATSSFRSVKPPVNECQACRCCPKGWLTFGQSCFFMSSQRLTWDEGLKNCTGRGGNLAIITDQTVQDFLTRNGGLTYWIGLRRTGSWAWVDDTPLDKSYWSNPDGWGECASLKTSSPDNNWFKDACTRPKYFICEIKYEASQIISKLKATQ